MIRLTLFFCLFLLACSQEVASPNASVEKAFFDLPTFFEEEINSLQQQVTALEKTATINGKTEKLRLEAYDLAEELTIFINSNINKSTWKGHFHCAHSGVRKRDTICQGKSVTKNTGKIA